MSMKTWVALASATLACSSVALARLGETSDQITARYGRARSLNETDGIAVYQHDSYYIRVEFKGRQAELMAYRKMPVEALGDREIAGLLDRHKGSGGWTAVSGSPGWRQWESADGSRVARYSIVNSMLIFMTRAEYERRKNWIPGSTPSR